MGRPCGGCWRQTSRKAAESEKSPIVSPSLIGSVKKFCRQEFLNNENVWSSFILKVLSSELEQGVLHLIYFLKVKKKEHKWVFGRAM